MFQQQAQTTTLDDYKELSRFILKGLAYAIFILLIMIDGLNHPVSFDARLLTLPYFVAGLALVRAFSNALDARYDFHAGVFAIGLSTLGALA